jgi:acetone carboxylase gamma subunit
MSTGYDDEDFIKYLEESDDAQVEELVRLAGVTLDASKNHRIMSTGYDDDDFIKYLEESDDAQVEELVRLAGVILDACKKKKTKKL